MNSVDFLHAGRYVIIFGEDTDVLYFLTFEYWGSIIVGPFLCDMHDIQKDIFKGKPPKSLDFK